jgi:type III secretion system YscI/HrpB-like protein
MSVINSVQSIVDTAQSIGQPTKLGLGSVAHIDEVGAFNSAYTRASNQLEAIQSPVKVAQIASSTAVDGSTSAASPQQQTLKALDLDKSKSSQPLSQGDAILSGLGKLQGIFANKQGELTSAINSGSLSAQSLMKVQMDLVQYTLLIDVASKVTGKVTQSVDTLVKGQ